MIERLWEVFAGEAAKQLILTDMVEVLGSPVPPSFHHYTEIIEATPLSLYICTTLTADWAEDTAEDCAIYLEAIRGTYPKV